MHRAECSPAWTRAVGFAAEAFPAAWVSAVFPLRGRSLLSPFRGIEACLLPGGAPPAAPWSVAIGLDLARYTDWTVEIAIDRDTGRALDMLRFNALEWSAQKARFLGLARRWHGAVNFADATGAGDPIVADLRHDWPRTKPCPERSRRVGSAHR